jgi:K+-transporting ATPase ATPase B chain
MKQPDETKRPVRIVRAGDTTARTPRTAPPAGRPAAPVMTASPGSTPPSLPPTGEPRPAPPKTPAQAETSGAMKVVAAQRRGGRSAFTGDMVRRAMADAFRKLDPRLMAKNPVMFVVEIGSVITTIATVGAAVQGSPTFGFTLQTTLWLWFTVLFANFAEAMAEARGRAQADTLRRTKQETSAKRLRHPAGRDYETVGSALLRKGDLVLVEENDLVPSDGEVVRGVAYVNEAAITGESAPVLKEPNTDIRSSVTGGTQVTSDWLICRITADPGETFLDRMIALVEGAKRQRTPNEIALSILLAGLTIIFLLAVVTLLPFAV